FHLDGSERNRRLRVPGASPPQRFITHSSVPSHDSRKAAPPGAAFLFPFSAFGGVASVVRPICLKPSPEALACLRRCPYPLRRTAMLRAGLLIASLLPMLSAAQTTASAASKPKLPAPPAATSSVEQVQLGNAVVPLTGPWKFHTGDNPGWAQPALDDSSWSDMDMTPARGPVPGWTARGFPGYA